MQRAGCTGLDSRGPLTLGCDWLCRYANAVGKWHYGLGAWRECNVKEWTAQACDDETRIISSQAKPAANEASKQNNKHTP